MAKFKKSINFPDEYKITQSDGVDSVYLHLDELPELKDCIEEALELASQEMMNAK